VNQPKNRLRHVLNSCLRFAKQYGFEFRCHAVKHPNRKAGEERSFWTVETNFLPGRTFASLEDLNRQALEWATVRMHHRAVKKTGLIPAKAFEHERRYLVELSPHLPAPYCVYERGTDEYGYLSFQGNYYWVPGSKREDVKILLYADRVKIYQQQTCLVEYPLPADGVKNARFSPPGQPAPRHLPKHRKHGSQHEEQRLRSGDRSPRSCGSSIGTRARRCPIPRAPCWAAAAARSTCRRPWQTSRR